MCVQEYPKIVLRAARYMSREIPVPLSPPCVSVVSCSAIGLRLVRFGCTSPLARYTPREFRRGRRGVFVFIGDSGCGSGRVGVGCGTAKYGGWDVFFFLSTKLCDGCSVPGGWDQTG